MAGVGNASGKRFVSWAAVSSRPQAEKVSLDEQLRVNREHIERWGGILVEELIVPGQSRSIVLFEDAAKRIEAYARLRELIDAAAFDVLIYFDRSRLGRIESLSMAVVALCQQAGIATYETYDPPQTLDANYSLDRSLTGAIKSILAREESEKFKKRRTHAIRQRAKAGKRIARVPYGYTRVFREDGTERVVVNQHEAESIRRIFDLYLSGRGHRTIAIELNVLGIPYRPDRTEWDMSTVRWIIGNVMRYAGYLDYAGIRAKSDWEPIISEETAQMILDEMDARRPSARFLHGPRTFSRAMICGVCGRTLTLRQVNKRNIRIQYYCPNRCRGVVVYEEEVLHEVQRAIVSLQDDSVFAELAEEFPNSQQRLDSRLGELNTHAASVASQRRNLTLSFTRGNLSLDEYESIMSELATQAEQIENEIAAIEDQLKRTRNEESRIARVEDVRRNGLERFNSPDIAALNAWVRRNFLITVKDKQVTQIEIL